MENLQIDCDRLIDLEEKVFLEITPAKREELCTEICILRKSRKKFLDLVKEMVVPQQEFINTYEEQLGKTVKDILFIESFSVRDWVDFARRNELLVSQSTRKRNLLKFNKV